MTGSAGQDPTAPPPGRVVLLAGPSGSGKSHLAHGCGLPVLSLDEFYKNGDDPSCPRQEALGIVDWDHPGSWDADAAFCAIEQVCAAGRANVPRYDISQDRAVATDTFSRDGYPVFVAEGIFAAELVARCAAAGLLADAIVISRRPWKNFLRRMARDLSERRKPPLTLLRRGRALLHDEARLVAAAQAAGCRALPAGEAAATLGRWASPQVGDSA